MAGYVAIPTNMMGTVLNEFQLQGALVRLNPEMNFDWGVRLGQWHPYQDSKQGIFFGPKHICSMDRGQIPQAPIWSTKTSSVRSRDEDLSYAEMVDPMRCRELEYLVDGSCRETGYSFVRRQVKDRLLFVGWQSSLRKVIRMGIPGITAESLTRELGVTIDIFRDDIEELEVAENRTHLYDASGREVSI